MKTLNDLKTAITERIEKIFYRELEHPSEKWEEELNAFALEVEKNTNILAEAGEEEDLTGYYSYSLSSMFAQVFWHEVYNFKEDNSYMWRCHLSEVLNFSEEEIASLAKQGISYQAMQLSSYPIDAGEGGRQTLKNLEYYLSQKNYSYVLYTLLKILGTCEEHYVYFVVKNLVTENIDKIINTFMLSKEVELSDEEYDEGFDESISLSGRLQENKRIDFLADYHRQIDKCMERLLPSKRTHEEWKELYYAQEIDNYRSLAFYYVYGSYQNWFKRLVFGSPYDNDYMCTRLRKEYDYIEEDVEQILDDYEPFRKKYSNFSRETINKNFSKDKQFVNMIQLLLNHDKQFSVMPYVEEILKNNPSIPEPKLEVELSDEEYDEGFDD